MSSLSAPYRALTVGMITLVTLIAFEAVAVTTAMPPGRFAVTINLQVSYLAVAKGQSLIARARAIQVGSTIGVAHVDVASVADGVETPCAVAVVTLRGVDLPAK